MLMQMHQGEKGQGRDDNRTLCSHSNQMRITLFFKDSAKESKNIHYSATEGCRK